MINDKHTPLTKLTKNKRKQNPHRKKDNIQRIKIENIKKSKAPLITTQKNKFHYNIEQNHYKKISCLDMVEQTAKNGRNLDDLPLRKLSAD